MRAEAWQRANRRNGVPTKDVYGLPGAGGDLIVFASVGGPDRGTTVKLRISLDEVLALLPKLVKKAEQTAERNARSEAEITARKAARLKQL